jgi:hypothetical protein
MVFGIVWAMLLMPESEANPIHVPLYLSYLMFLILGSYFAARGHAPAATGAKQHHPLYLPRGSLRFLMIIGFLAAFGWGYYRNPDIFKRLNPPDPGESGPPQAFVAIFILGAFFVGIIVTRIGHLLLADSDGRLPAWFQDVLAWIALISVLLLVADYLLHLLINPNLAPERQIPVPPWEGMLTALVAFYFGARSGS